MNIQDFKQELLDKTLNDDLIIFVNSENSFLAESYIDEICEQKNLSKNYIATLAETVSSALALVMNFSSDLNIIKVDEFTEHAEDYNEFKNCVVICNKIATEIKTETEPYVISIPKLTDWQIIDYIMTVCPGLSEDDAAWLYSATGKNIFVIDKELNKLCLVDQAKQSAALKIIEKDLFVKRPVFELVDALVKADFKTAKEFLVHATDYSSQEIDPIGLTTLTLAKFKNILLLNYKSGVSEEQLGISKGAAWHIKNDNRNIPLSRIEKAIKFLSNINSRLRANPSNLDFTGNRPTALLEYIILGVLSCGA